MNSNAIVTVGRLQQFKDILYDNMYTRTQLATYYATKNGVNSEFFDCRRLNIYNLQNSNSPDYIGLYVQMNNNTPVLKFVNGKQETTCAILPLAPNGADVWTSATFDPTTKADKTEIDALTVTVTYQDMLDTVTALYSKNPQVCVFRFLTAATNSTLSVADATSAGKLSVTGAAIQTNDVVYVSSSQLPEPSINVAGFYLAGTVVNNACALHFITRASANSVYYNKHSDSNSSQFYYGTAQGTLTAISISGSGGGGGGGDYTVADDADIIAIFDD